MSIFNYRSNKSILYIKKSIYALRFFFFFQAEDGIRDIGVTGVQTCALPIFRPRAAPRRTRRRPAPRAARRPASTQAGAREARHPLELTPRGRVRASFRPR